MSAAGAGRRLRTTGLTAAAALAASAAALPGQVADSASAARAVRAAGVDTIERRVVLRDLGAGAAGRVLRGTLARPHVALAAGDTGVDLARGARFDRTVVVVGGDARVASTVSGDVVVVGGDLFLHPGATVDGRVIAIGGGVYNSTLANVRGERLSYRDVTFDEVPGAAGELALAYRAIAPEPSHRVWLPGTFGVRLPAYNRIDGLALTFGPEVALGSGRVRIEPTLTYRSHLGVVDPSLVATATPGRRVVLGLRAGRETRTNEAWIRQELLNSVLSFGTGLDVRNYYRVDRAEATAARSWETSSTIMTPFVGASYERSWPVGRDASSQSRPYSVFGRDDREEGMLRPNPAVTGGHVASALLGAALRVEAAEVTGTAAAHVEVPFTSPGDGRWTQVVLDGALSFPAFRDHRFDAFAHGVATMGDLPPTQRFVYLGGSGTIHTLPLLSRGGDQLAWLETRYNIPLNFVHVPFGGVPSFTLRHIVGGAGVDGFPSLTQNVGLRLTVAMLRLDYTFNPADRAGSGFSIGIGLR